MSEILTNVSPPLNQARQWKPLASMDLCQEVWHIWQRPNWLNRWARMAQTQDGQSWPQHWMAKKRSGGWPSGLSPPTFCWCDRHSDWLLLPPHICTSCHQTDAGPPPSFGCKPPFIASYLVSDNCDMPHISFPCQPVTFRHYTWPLDLWGHLGNHPCLKPVILQLPKNQQLATNTPHQLMIRMFFVYIGIKNPCQHLSHKKPLLSIIPLLIDSWEPYNGLLWCLYNCVV